jgi:hypothetical protein
MARKRARVINGNVWKSERHRVGFGRLDPVPGQKPIVGNLFLCIGEKLPFECLLEVRKHVRAQKFHPDGVYMAHDSFGVPRYGGRGRIFSRLASRKRKYPDELAYFSFYIVKQKNHEKELENAILRAAGPQMAINKVKVRTGPQPGSVRDYEPGTHFYRRFNTTNQRANPVRRHSPKRLASKSK